MVICGATRPRESAALRVSDGSAPGHFCECFPRQAAALSHRRRFRTDSPLMIFLPEPDRQNRVLVSLRRHWPQGLSHDPRLPRRIVRRSSNNSSQRSDLESGVG
jgi:hypothetical protein